MLEALERLSKRHEEVTEQMADPDVFDDPQKIQDLARERSELDDIVERYRSLDRIEKQIAEARVMVDNEADSEMAELAREELAALQPRADALLAELRELLIPRDPNDAKNVIVEIRAGAGGDEAALFAGALYKMLTRYAEARGFSTEGLSQS